MYLVKGISAGGGFLGMVGGSLIMGFAWGFVVWKSRLILLTTSAHILTNFFAFTGFIYINWYM